jgi:hypothetical protein
MHAPGTPLASRNVHTAMVRAMTASISTRVIVSRWLPPKSTFTKASLAPTTTPHSRAWASRYRAHTSEHTQSRGVQVAIVGLLDTALVHTRHRKRMRNHCLIVGFPVHLGSTRCAAENMLCKAQTLVVWCVLVTVVLCSRTCVQYAHSGDVYVHINGHMQLCVPTGRTSLGCVAHRGRSESCTRTRRLLVVVM